MTPAAKAVRQGAAITVDVRNRLPYCSARCLYRTDGDECQLAPGLAMDSSRLCPIYVEALVDEVELLRDRVVQLRLKVRR